MRVVRCATQDLGKIPSWTLPWNPTLAQKTRKDGASIGQKSKNKSKFFGKLLGRGLLTPVTCGFHWWFLA